MRHLPNEFKTVIILLIFSPQQPNYPALAKECNLARNHNDIQDSWDSMISAIDYYGDDQYGFAEVAGPGFFNDPDMVKKR